MKRVPPSPPPSLDSLLGSPEALAVVELPTLEIRGCTAALASMLGRPASELRSRRFPELHDPLGREDLERWLEPARSNPPAAVRVQLLGAAGAVPAELTWLNLFPEGGPALAALLVRPTTSAPLADPLYRQVLEALPTDVAVLDAQGRYLYCNPAAIRSPEVRRGILGRTDREYVTWRGLSPAIADRREELFARARDAREPYVWEEQLQSPAGVKLMRRVYAPVYGEDGGLMLMLGYGADITESLVHSERMNLLEHVTHASSEPLLVLDARPGSGFQQVVYANPALEYLLAQHEVTFELYGRPTDWNLGERDRVVVDRLLDALQGSDALNTTIHLPEAREWLEVSAHSILDTAGQRTHWAVGLKRITDSRRSEDAKARLAQATLLTLRGESMSLALSGLLGALGDWLDGWQVALVHDDGGELQVHGTLPAALKRHLGERPPGQLRADWNLRDPQHLGLPFIVPDASGCPGDPLDPLLGVRRLIEVPLYDGDQGFAGVLVASHDQPGEIFPDQVALLCEDAAGTALLLERYRQRRQLEQLAFTDTLTGLLNRRTFGLHLDAAHSAALTGGSALVLGLMDLDRFKQVNDGLGHLGGDELLRELARRLRGLACPELIALARMGGDEFAFLLSDRAALTAFDQGLRAALAAPFEIGGSSVQLQASAGWSIYPDTASDSTALLQQADAAMYTAKRTHAFSHLYSGTARPGILPLTLETAMRQGLSAGEFRLVFQPQISCLSGEVLGAEALLRWTHPSLGNIRPDEFIPVAEVTGMIVPLGEWVLHSACGAAARWPDSALKVSVNVSATQLASPGFEGHVKSALEVSGLHPGRLVLEVTETGLLVNPEQTRQLLQRLRELGVGVSIDDFGTGYSSMVSLKTLPVDELKIDQTFIRGLGEETQAGRECRAIIEASILLAHALNLTVVAEGIETPEQARLLRSAGCDAGQGWLFAPGMEPDAFGAWLGSQLAGNLWQAPPGDPRRSGGTAGPEL